MRDCENCKHYVEKVEVGKGSSPEHYFGCDSWECEFEPTTKNDLGVDCIRRQDVLSEIIRFSTEEGASVECQQLYCDVNNMPSVTPQEPKPMVEIDLYSVIKQKYIEREVLDKIRAEVENINVWGMRYNPDTDKDRKPQIVQKVKEHVIEILDKYKAESEANNGNDD